MSDPSSNDKAINKVTDDRNTNVINIDSLVPGVLPSDLDFSMLEPADSTLPDDSDSSRISTIPSLSPVSSLGILDSISQTSFQTHYSNEGNLSRFSLPSISSTQSSSRHRTDLRRAFQDESRQMDQHMLVDPSNTTSASSVVSLSENEDQMDETPKQTRQVAWSSPLSTTDDVSVENYFSHIRSLDSTSTSGDTTDSSRQTDDGSLNRRISDAASFTSASSSSNVEEVSQTAQEDNAAPATANLTDSLGDATVMQTFQLGNSDTIRDETAHSQQENSMDLAEDQGMVSLDEERTE